MPPLPGSLEFDIYTKLGELLAPNKVTQYEYSKVVDGKVVKGSAAGPSLDQLISSIAQAVAEKVIEHLKDPEKCLIVIGSTDKPALGGGIVTAGVAVLGGAITGQAKITLI